MNYLSTICAISTASGVGGIAVIRVSGTEAIAISNALLESKHLQTQAANSVSLDRIVNDKGDVIDEALVTVFRAPHSFTGEDIVEISCHGSLFVQQEILRLLMQKGAELAKPGEFTQRAFLNGKMDLSQAEAVVDVIASSSAGAHRIAMQQMRGGFSRELAKLRDDLLTFVSLIELELDFSEEEVEFANRTQLLQLAEEISTKLSHLANSFSVGNAIKNGIPVAIVGETNAGKSTLLNYLLEEEKAIVSDIHGTTRDVIEDTISINGINFRFIDTAGIRETIDAIETIGIERTFQKIEQSSIVLWIIDSTQVSEHIDWLAKKISPKLIDKKLILVFNKSDKTTAEEKIILENLFVDISAERIHISAKEKINTEELKKVLVATAQIPEIAANDVIVSNARHYEALNKALTAITRVQQGLEQKVPGDLLSQDIRECMFYLGEITGSIGTEEILGTIFSRFCVGK